MRESLVIVGLVVISLLTLRWPFLGVLTIMVAAVLRDTMIIETYGAFVFYHGYEVLYIATLVSIVLAHPGRLNEFTPKSLTDWGMLGFLGAMCISAFVNGVSIWYSKYIDLFFKAVVLYFLLSRLADNPRRVTLVAWALIASTTYLVYLAWSKYRGGLMYYARPYYRTSFHEFGLQLVITLPLIGAMLNRRLWLPLRVALLGMVPLYVLVTLRSHSRSGMLGMAFGLVLLAWYHRRRWYWLLLATPLVAYAIAHNPDEVIRRMESIWTHEAVEGGEDTSIAGRFEQMRTALNVVSSSPMFGIGPRQYFYRYAEFQESEDKAKYGREVQYTMHSVPLLILCEEGLFGVVVFGLIVLGSLRDAWRVVRQARGDPVLEPTAIVAAGAFMGFLAFLAYGLAQPQMWVINIYATVALASAAHRVAAVRRAEVTAGERQTAAEVPVPWLPHPAVTEVVFS